jgi:hypothetical protein
MEWSSKLVFGKYINNLPHLKKKEYHIRYPKTDGRLTLKRIFKKPGSGMLSKFS